MSRKLVQINTVCNASTGRIMCDIQKYAEKMGYETFSFVGRRKIPAGVKGERFGNGFSFWMHVVITTLSDRQGYGSYFTTRRLIRGLRRENPDIIHLHNLHGYYLNLPVLLRYLTEEYTGRIFWTFHDCWPFTGHCAYYTAAGCQKWKEGCGECINKKHYPVSLFLDASRQNYQDKKRLFGSLKDLTIIVPSGWMAEQVRDSFFKNRDVAVIHNGIDLHTFYYDPNEDVLFKYHVPTGKKLLLGVANIWDGRKGLNDFLLLAESISEEYQIVLVGLSRAQIRKLPANITGIRRTESREELRALYSAADIFMNPSLEESFSLVTAEALACGTPVIALDTSAVKELICEENGIVLHRHDTEAYFSAVRNIEERKFSREAVRHTAEKYEKEDAMRKIMELYGEGSV